MALSGILLVGFLLGHLAGNLLIFQGRQAMNDYAEFLKSDIRIGVANTQKCLESQWQIKMKPREMALLFSKWVTLFSSTHHEHETMCERHESKNK